MITPADLRRYIGAIDGPDVSDESLAEALAVAQGLIDKRVSTAVVPPAVLDFCIREVAANVYRRQEDGNGVRGFNQDGTAIFYSRDVMASVKPMLDPYVMPW